VLGDVAVLRAQRRRDLHAARSQPNLQRPYKVVGYPIVPAVFIAAAIYLVVNALDHGSEVDVDYVCRVLLGLPVYYIAFNKPR
jgi:APA family basic amino acid/polyamine antiporter